MTILVAEDDPDQLAIRALLLEQCGFGVLKADSYATAMAAVAAVKPDCAVIDLRLPREQDGLQLIRDLKGLLPEVLVYVITGSRSHLGVAPPELALAEGVFGKGTSIRPLLQRLKNLQAERQEV